MSELQDKREEVERTLLTFRVGAYYVNRPNIDSLEFVKSSDYDQLLAANREQKAEIERLTKALRECAEENDQAWDEAHKKRTELDACILNRGI